MKRVKSVTAVAAALGAMAVLPLPPSGAAPGQADAREKETDTWRTPEEGLDLESPDGVETYLKRLGLTQDQLESVAKRLDISLDTYLDNVAESTKRNAGRVPPVELKDGKIRYNANVSDAMDFYKTQRRTQVGEKKDGDCKFDDILDGAEIGEHVVSEVVELDPETCTRIVFDGAYSPQQSQFEEQVVAARAPNGPRFLDCYESRFRTAPPTLYQPDGGPADGEYRRYYKHSFVDPVCIAITSTTLNGRWKNTPNSSSNVTVIQTAANSYYFTLLGEQWPVGQRAVLSVPGAGQHPSTPTEGTMRVFHIRTETDFPEHLAAAANWLGVGPYAFTWALCGFDFGDTTFESDQWLLGRRNGAWWASGYADVSGGCATLVHDRVWHGSGSFAR